VKICIVGGGSAGWMSATTFARLTNHEVILVESPSISITGVGESTLFKIKHWIDLVGIGEDEPHFIRETNGTFKHSIKLTNFLRKDSGGFHYPFGDNPHIHPEDWWKYKNAHPNVSCNYYGQEINPLGLLAERGKFDKGEQYSYQFDAVKFGQYLKNNYCQRVKHIIGEVVGYVGDSVRLDNGEWIEADLFIDCTGFKSKLLGELLDEPFISYEHLLPNDSAWTTRVPFIDKEKQMVAYTECTAIDNGWVWQIPLWDKIGTGYVYSSKYIDDFDAKEQFESHLYNKGWDVSRCVFKKVPMKVGRYKRTWVKNVVAIGLSAGFLEPLESNSLLTVHQNLLVLYNILKRGKPSQLLKDYYNNATSLEFDEWADFIAVHYALTQRDDTPYWRDIFNKQYDLTSPDNYQRFGLTAYGKEIYNDKNFSHLGAGFHYIASGMELSPYTESDPSIDYSEAWQKWENIIQEKPSLYQHLKDTIYEPSQDS